MGTSKNGSNTKYKRRGRCNFCYLRKKSSMLHVLWRIKILPRNRMEEIALWHRVFAIIRFWETYKLRQNLWKPSKINTFKQFPIFPEIMFLGRKIPRNTFLGDSICFWEQFWEDKMLLGSVTPFWELSNIRRCCYA